MLHKVGWVVFGHLIVGHVQDWALVHFLIANSAFGLSWLAYLRVFIFGDLVNGRNWELVLVIFWLFLKYFGVVCHVFEDYSFDGWGQVAWLYFGWKGLFWLDVFNVVVFLDVGVESVFDFVLWPADDFFADFGPPGTNLQKELNDGFVLFLGPFVLLDFGIELINKSLTNLFTSFALKHLREELPVFANLFNHLQNGFVLLGRPYFAVDTQLRQSPVPMKTLIFISVGHKTGNRGPFLRVLLVELH